MSSKWKSTIRKIASSTALAGIFLGSLLPGAAFANVDTPEVIAGRNDTSWIQEQQTREQDILEQFESGNYTLDNPLVVVDPYGYAPLSALVLFETDVDTKATVTIHAKADSKFPEYSTIIHEFETLGTEHYLPVYGLYADLSTKVTIDLFNAGGTKVDSSDIVITADPENTVQDFYKDIVVSELAIEYNGYKANNIVDNKANNGNPVELTEAQVEEMYLLEPGNGALTYTLCAGATGCVVGVDLDGEIRAVIACADGPAPVRRDLIDAETALETGLTATGHGTGNILAAMFNSSTTGQTQNGIIELNSLGKIYKEWLTNYLHHEFAYNIDNDSWIIDAGMPSGWTVEDYLEEISYTDGSKMRDWDLHDVFDLKEYVADEWSGSVYDWAHVNSLTFVRDDSTATLGDNEDAILFSPRHQDGVYKLNLGENEIEWFVSAPNPNNWTEEFAAKALTPVMADGTPVDEWWYKKTGEHIDWTDPYDPYFWYDEDGDGIYDTPFEYVWGQHAVSTLPNGDYFIFDNGDGRTKVGTGLPAEENYSRAVIYRIDEEAGTVQQLWQIGKEFGPDYYCSFICDVDYLAEDHYLICFGAVGQIIEVKDGEVIYTLTGGTSRYRAERMTVYAPDEGEFEFGVKGQALGMVTEGRPLFNSLDLADTYYVAPNSTVELDTIVIDNWNEFSPSAWTEDAVQGNRNIPADQWKSGDLSHPETAVSYTSSNSGFKVTDGVVTAADSGNSLVTVKLNADAYIAANGGNNAQASCNIIVADTFANVGDAAVKAGGQVTVPVTIYGNPGLKEFKAQVIYDKDEFNLVNITAGDMTQGFEANAATGEVSAKINEASAAYVEDGVLFNIVLQAKADAKDGQYGLEVNFLSSSLTEELGANRGIISVNDNAAGDIIVLNIDDPAYSVNKIYATADVAPYIDTNDRTMVPIRFVAEAIGAKVDYDSEKGEITIAEGQNTIVLKVGASSYTLNGKTVAIDTQAVSVDGRVMLPLRAVAEALGADVDYADEIITIAK